MAKKAVVLVRMDQEILDIYRSKCQELGKNTCAMTREMIEAFNEGRVKIEISDKQKQLKKELYDA